jgi:hypothetical protein
MLRVRESDMTTWFAKKGRTSPRIGYLSGAEPRFLIARTGSKTTAIASGWSATAAARRTRITCL